MKITYPIKQVEMSNLKPIAFLSATICFIIGGLILLINYKFGIIFIFSSIFLSLISIMWDEIFGLLTEDFGFKVLK